MWQIKKYQQLSGSVIEEVKGNDGSDDSEDSDYMPGDACSSKKDDEAAEILSKYKAFKKKLRKWKDLIRWCGLRQ